MKNLFILAFALLSFSLQAQTFTLKSNDLTGQATAKEVFNGFGCTGENVSPHLSWENAPEGTQSFAITLYDPDAPTGSGWWHWLVFDIPANVNELIAGAGNGDLVKAPANSVQSVTDYGINGYGGPCPPEGHGYHQYIMTVYALKVPELGLKAETNPAVVGYYINSNTLAKASLVFYHQR